MKHKHGDGGKGDKPRQVDKSRFDKEFDRIFGKPSKDKKKKVK